MLYRKSVWVFLPKAMTWDIVGIIITRTLIFKDGGEAKPKAKAKAKGKAKAKADAEAKAEADEI